VFEEVFIDEKIPADPEITDCPLTFKPVTEHFPL